MPTPQKFHQFIEDVYHGVHDFSSDTFKAMLTLSAPDAATDAVKADVSEISAGSGYSAGGITLTVDSSGQTSGVYKLVFDDASFTASGGDFAQARYVVVYNDTATGDPLVCFIDYGAAFTLLNGQSLPLDFSAGNGLFQGS